MIRSALLRVVLAAAASVAMVPAPGLPALWGLGPPLGRPASRRAASGWCAQVGLGGYAKRPRQTHKQARRASLKVRAVRRAKRSAR